MLDEREYRAFFYSVVGAEPYDYQVQVAEKLAAKGRSVVLRAPTGAGKTWAVVVPFLYPKWERRPARLIYALPLRTLAQGVYRKCQEAAARLDLPQQSRLDERGREVVAPYVTLQTGEQPDDPFFARGTIVVTTYDQLLSGLLDGPYGLSGRLHNINAAVIAGALVVFDEFHLMPSARAFLTATALLHLFRSLSQSVWMTATATRSLDDLLAEALATAPIPDSDAELDSMLKSLPSVERVQRDIRWEGAPITPAQVLDEQPCRSIVLLNTVDRAQAMFMELRALLSTHGRHVPLMLLHSRFFKEDRRDKERAIDALVGKRSSQPAIVVATQVVEAGLDISSDHLHTELCPMNALVQRAGRCARFEGEKGIVHVHELPGAPRAWLPYGDLNAEAVTLRRTRDVLQRRSVQRLDPKVAADWVQYVHGDEDERALQEGWRARQQTCLRRIESNAIHRAPVRIADLIRGDDEDTIRVVVAEKPPAKPAIVEGLSLRRGSLRRLAAAAPGGRPGWVWDGSDEVPWKEIAGPQGLQDGYVVCLRPGVAAYDADVGLRLGTPGTHESPPRTAPPRPGYAPLTMEPWVRHARAVAHESTKRLEREHMQDGLVGAGFRARYDVPSSCVVEAATVCALLHDLGKLQATWQRWAEAWQTTVDRAYRHERSLAHTDFDPASNLDWLRQRQLGVVRPGHAAASAYFGGAFLAQGLPSAPPERLAFLASACAAAVLAHHGGWLPATLNSEIAPLCPGWEKDLAGIGFHPDAATVEALARREDKCGALAALLEPATAPDRLAEYWPLVAYLTRTLRLSDQRATAEGHSGD